MKNSRKFNLHRRQDQGHKSDLAVPQASAQSRRLEGPLASDSRGRGVRSRCARMLTWRSQCAGPPAGRVPACSRPTCSAGAPRGSRQPVPAHFASKQQGRLGAAFPLEDPDPGRTMTVLPGALLPTTQARLQPAGPKSAPSHPLPPQALGPEPAPAQHAPRLGLHQES